MVFAAEAFNKLVTLRWSEIQRKLRINQEIPEPELRRGDVDRERKKIENIAFSLWQLYKNKIF